MKLGIKAYEKGSKTWIKHEFYSCQIFTGYVDKNDYPIYTGDIIEYNDFEDGEYHKYRAEVTFTISNGARLHWDTWKPFRKDINYWLSQKENVEIIYVEKEDKDE